MSELFLCARGVQKSFGEVEVLHGIDMDVYAGSVLALLGENGAGKSTLVRILAGDHQPDGGTITVAGGQTRLRDVKSARDLGIRLIHQEISDAPVLTVTENICLGAWPSRRGLVDREAMRTAAGQALRKLGVALPLEAKVETLRLGERQIVEIARALTTSVRCVILDEPTAVLSDVEAERLFAVVQELRKAGVAVVYITHRLDEVFRIADDVCVLRDGNVALRCAVSQVSRPEVVEAMVGCDVLSAREGDAAPQPASHRPRAELREATSAGAFQDVSLAVVPGEVAALYGKVGSGAPEVAEALAGARRLTAGSLRVGGVERVFRHPAEAILAGVGFLPGDRQREGAFRPHTVGRNVSAPSWGRLAWRSVFVSRRRESAAYHRWHDELRVRSRGDADQPIWQLSGGNQQKVLLGRWLERRSTVLVLVEPARGVDVAARQEIYRAIREQARRGAAVVVATSDHEDVMELATTGHVMVQGRIVRTLPRADLTVQTLTDAAGGTIHA